MKRLWQDKYKPDYNPHVDKLTNGKITRNLRIGFSSYWFNDQFTLDDYITKNSKEVLYLREFFKLGYVYWLGLSPRGNKIPDHPRAIDCSYEFKERLPKWDKARFGTTPDYMRSCIEGYSKEYGINLPKLDLVYMNLMPTFVRRNARNYVLLHHYAINNNTIVLAYDPGLELVYQGVKEYPKVGGRTAETDSGKLMNISGYDYRDKAAHLKMAPNMVHLVQTGKWGLKTLRLGNPLLRFCTWWLPYDPLIVKELPISDQVRYRLAYVGNDNRRRNAFKKWFGPQPDGDVHIFGGNYRKDKQDGASWPEVMLNRFPNITFHNPVQIKNVAYVYNKCVGTMNLSVPPFEAVGEQVWRHIEAPFGGCPILSPSTTKHAEKLSFDDSLVMQSPQELTDTLETLAGDKELRTEIIEMQKEVIKKRYNMKVNLRHLFEEITDALS